MSRVRFEQLVGEAIVSLAQDMKAVLRIVEDPEIDDVSRESAAGALIHVLSGPNVIPGMRGILGYVDDVLVLRLVLERIERSSPEAMARHREQSPELLEPLVEQLETVRAYLGTLVSVLEGAVDGLPKLTHLGHTPRQCVEDAEGTTWLYDEVQEAIVEQLEFDEDEVNREVKHVDRILEALRTRIGP